MEHLRYRLETLLGGTIICLLLWVTVLFAQTSQLGKAQHSTGTLLVVRADGIEDRLRGQGALNLFEQDVLRTDPNSQALVDFGEGTRMGLNENTTVQIFSRWEKAIGTTKIIRVKKGQVWVKTIKPLEVETSSGVAVMQNAEIDFKVAEDGQAVLSVAQGPVQFATSYGWCTVAAGSSSSGARGRGCSPSVPANIQQVLRWSADLAR